MSDAPRATERPTANNDVAPLLEFKNAFPEKESNGVCLSARSPEVITAQNDLSKIMQGKSDLPEETKSLEQLGQKLDQRINKDQTCGLNDVRSEVGVNLAHNYLNSAKQAESPEQKEALRQKAVTELTHSLDLNQNLAQVYGANSASFMQAAILSGATQDKAFMKKFTEASKQQICY